MKTTISILALALGFFLSTNALAINTTLKSEQQFVAPISDLTKAELESILERKMKVSEWIAFKLSTKKSRKNIKQRAGSGGGDGFGILGLVMGVLGLVTFSFIFALLGITR